MREIFWGIKYNYKSLVQNKSPFHSYQMFQTYRTNILEQIEPTIASVNETLTKQERKALNKLKKIKIYV